MGKTSLLGGPRRALADVAPAPYVRHRPVVVAGRTSRSSPMRLVMSAALAVGLLAIGSATRADDKEEGSIGVKVKLEDGKIIVDEPIKGSPAEKAGIKAN